MREAITELRHQFKFIVIDSPPVMAATDAVMISALTDGVLLVVRSGETPKEAFTRTRDLLAAVKCRLLGVVLNAVDSSAPDYYYSYRYYPYAYGYGYGEDVGKTPKFPPGSDDEGPGSKRCGLALSHNRRRRVYRLPFIGSAFRSRRRSFCPRRSFHGQRRKHSPPESRIRAFITFSIRSLINTCSRSWWTKRT